MSHETVIQLRKQLRERFPAAHRDALLTPPQESPLPCQEARSPISTTAIHSLKSGFPQGGITEISPTHPACGLSLLVGGLLDSDDDRAPHPGLPLVLIDARDQFDPGSFSDEDCRKVLWLRCREPRQALKSADLLLRDGNLPLVLLDLSTLPARELQRIPRSSWHRLRQLAESTQSTLLALTPSPIIPGTALRLTLTRHHQLADLLLTRGQLQDSLEMQVTRATAKARSA